MSRPRRVVVAPDKFKGSLSADEVASTVAAVLARSPGAEVVRHPVADGGEGTVDLALAAGFRPVTVTVSGPLGEPVEATFALRNRTAVLEMAAAAGLALLPDGPGPATARSATTYGVGELILAALDRGATRIVVGAGGSAATDGGAGAVEALARDESRLAEIDLVVACDVDNPLVGPSGAAAVYAPQKGAAPDDVAALEERLLDWADSVAAATRRDLRHLPGVGAAGGLAFGLVAVAGARLVPGADLLLELSGFDGVVAAADLVVVGEGSLDRQSLRGKGPVSVARSAAGRGATVVAVTGRNELTEDEWRSAGLSAVYALSDLESDPEVSMRDARQLLSAVASRVAADWLA